MKKIRLLQLFFASMFVLSMQSGAVRKVKRKNPESEKTQSSANKSDSVKGNQSDAVILDDFGAVFTWKKTTSKSSEISSSKVSGKFGNALEIDYNLAGGGEWVAIEKFFDFPKYENFEIALWAKATGNENTLEIKLIDKDNSTFGYKVPIEINKWQKIVVEKYMFAYWWGGNQEQNEINRINLAISPSDGGGGTVIFDRMTITSIGAYNTEKIIPGLLDGFEACQGWIKPSSLPGTKLVLGATEGKKGNAIKLNYDLGAKGEWVSLYKQIDFKKRGNFKVFKFWAKATGNMNRLEFKVIDKDGSVFGKKFEWIESKWEEIRVSKNGLTYWWGGDDKMDEIEKIEFSISTIDGGSGAMYLDELGYE